MNLMVTQTKGFISMSIMFGAMEIGARDGFYESSARDSVK